MKKFKNIIYAILAISTIAFVSCEKNFLELSPQDSFTDAVYFTKPTDFKSYTAGFYSQLQGWKYFTNIYSLMDVGSDLSAPASTLGVASIDYARGAITVPSGDGRWSTPYSWIRTVNILIQKGSEYKGNSADIAPYVSEAYFFRANAYFELLRNYGGVPIVTTVLDTKSEELTAPRNSRYEVVDLILSDLDKAIANLPAEQTIAASDKGRVSKWAAKAFKAKVMLFEATWRKSVGTTTDFSGSKGATSDQTQAFLTEAAALCKDVMDNGGYELWDYNSKLSNHSNYYLFNLEDAGSNPAALTKTTNKEFILYSVYDFTYRQGGINISHTAGQIQPSRKMVDLYLCTDGLPPAKSPLFQGYHKAGDEFKNRDYRLKAHHAYTGLPSAGGVTLNGQSGYGNWKFASYNYGTYRNANQESANYPIIRLADVYLMYAEALIEKNGTITDAQLNESVNKVRARAGVAPLTNALATTNGLNIKQEIRDERAREFWQEGFRFDDLKRWGIAETELTKSTCGYVVGDASYATDFKDASGNPNAKYLSGSYVWGEETVSTAAGNLKCLVIDKSTNRNFQRKHYLLPVPSGQITINPNLVQNPGYQ